MMRMASSVTSEGVKPVLLEGVGIAIVPVSIQPEAIALASAARETPPLWRKFNPLAPTPGGRVYVMAVPRKLAPRCPGDGCHTRPLRSQATFRPIVMAVSLPEFPAP